MKPQPKQEIKIIVPSSAAILWLYFATPDVELWASQEAPAFGNYFPPDDLEKHGTLFVSPLYDIEEVKQYLETQGQD